MGGGRLGAAGASSAADARRRERNGRRAIARRVYRPGRLRPAGGRPAPEAEQEEHEQHQPHDRHEVPERERYERAEEDADHDEGDRNSDHARPVPARAGSKLLQIEDDQPLFGQLADGVRGALARVA